VHQFRRAAAAGIASAFLATVPVSVAEAQARDRCHDYATEMISMDQRARQTRCTPWGNHSNYQIHYQYCQARSPAVVQQALAGWGTEFQRCQFQASGSPVAQPPRPSGATIRSGTYTMNASNHIATVTLNVQGATFSGQSAWQCCPSTRIDPIVQGRIANGRITFVRDCRGQGYQGPCQQTYTGVIVGNYVSGTWSGTGIRGQGRWSMQLR
jgi:hypothetical protein